MGNLGVQRLALRCRGLGPRSGCRQRSSKTTSQPAMAAASGACKACTGRAVAFIPEAVAGTPSSQWKSCPLSWTRLSRVCPKHSTSLIKPLEPSIRGILNQKTFRISDRAVLWAFCIELLCIIFRTARACIEKETPEDTWIRSACVPSPTVLLRWRGWCGG